MRALGLVNRTVREINEMRYEFDEPFIVDASRAETELGLRATPLTDAVEQTVRWYRAQGAPSSATDVGVVAPACHVPTLRAISRCRGSLSVPLQQGLPPPRARWFRG